jgi:DNA-binding transcriptional LysR family regulator
MELGSREAIKGAVAAGLGVAVLSSTTVTKEIRLGELVAIPLEPPLRDSYRWSIRRKNSAASCCSRSWIFLSKAR